MTRAGGAETLVGRARWRLHRARSGLIEALWPPRCAGCGLRETWLCAECLAGAPAWSPPWCRTCGVPDDLGCRCSELPSIVACVRSIGLYDGWLQTAVHQFKYGQESARSTHLGSMMVNAIADVPTPELLIPVPLHDRRMRERGYNQSALLAQALAKESGIGVEPSAVARVVNTPHQTRLSAADRQRNLSGAFKVTHPERITGRRLMIVDDVLTTGATIRELARELHKAGARSISVVTVGRALGHGRK